MVCYFVSFFYAMIVRLSFTWNKMPSAVRRRSRLMAQGQVSMCNLGEISQERTARTTTTTTTNCVPYRTCIDHRNCAQPQKAPAWGDVAVCDLCGTPKLRDFCAPRKRRDCCG